MENTAKETKFCSYPLKLTATWDFILKWLELTIHETAWKSWNMPAALQVYNMFGLALTKYAKKENLH